MLEGKTLALTHTKNVTEERTNERRKDPWSKNKINEKGLGFNYKNAGYHELNDGPTDTLYEMIWANMYQELAKLLIRDVRLNKDNTNSLI